MSAETTSLRDQVIKSRIYSPALMSGDVVTFLPSEKNTFFVRKDGEESYVKHEGQYLKVTLDTAIDCRVLYFASYGEKEKKKAIKEELIRLKNDLVKRAEKIIATVTKYEQYQTGDYGNPALADLMDAIKERYQDVTDARKMEGNLFFQQYPDAIVYRANLQRMINEKDYNGLHSLLDNPIEQPLASFKMDGDLTALKKVFGFPAINKTIKKMQSGKTLEVIATMNVEKKYHPNI